MTTMMFRLTGSDDLSGVLDRVGDAARRLGRRLTVAAIDGDAALNRLRQNAGRNLADLRDDSHKTGLAGEALKKTLISLAPAAIPAAASMAPLAAGTAAAGLAAAAYGAALGPQIKAMGEASQAEKAYTDAVEESGARSQAAVKAHETYVRTVDKMPPSTRKAAAALSVFKDEYKGWSDSVAADTTAPVVKGMGLIGALLPKLTPMARSFGSQLDRTFTIAGGAMASPGLDSMMAKLDKFASGTLQRANDKLVQLMRTSDGGKVGGSLSEFMRFAREQGPVVADVLGNVGRALANVVIAGSDVGVGMLQAVDVLARLVAAVPPGAISVLLQLAIALRVAKLASIGMGAGRAALVGFGVQLVAMQTAAAGVPGRMAAARASIAALSRTAKVAVAGTGIGLLVIALGELMQMGQRAPVDMDRMTTSLGKFAQTGKLSGEAARVSGGDFREFDEALRGMARPGQLDQIQQSITSFFGMDSTPVKRWKGTLDDVDKGLASMVQSGNADLAAQAFDRYAQHAKSTGMTTGELTKELGDYKAAQDAARFEQQLAAASMGVFGAQAQAVQAKLDAQKRSTDGLRQSIIALNEVNRAAVDGRAGMEAAIDAAAEGAKKHAEALHMSGGELDLNSAKAREASGFLNDLARKTEENVTSARESGKSWDYAKGQYDRGKSALISAADAMGLSRSEAKRYAEQILQTPNKTAYIKGNIADLQGKLTAAKNKLANVPDSRKASVRATIAQLEAQIAKAKRELASMDGRTATASIMIQYRTEHGGGSAFAKSIGGYAGGGNPRAGEWAWVGEEGPELVQFKGGETVHDHSKSMGMASAGMDAGRGLAVGLTGSVSHVDAAARTMAAAVATGVRAELEIASPSRKMKSIAKDIGAGLIVGLTGTRERIAAVSKNLAAHIASAFKGVNSKTDDRLIARVNSTNKRLQTLAAQRDKIAAQLTEARKFAADIQNNARGTATLSSLGEESLTAGGGGIMGGLATKLANMQQFTRYIKGLTAKGLNKSILKQLLEMGPEAGFSYASTLAGSSKGTIAQINQLQAQIDKQSSTLGSTAADALYDAGRNAGKGLLTGLTSQKAAIEKLMIDIAKAMQKSIKRALGIKSPSTVMAEVGGYATEGLALGLMQRTPVLEAALGAVAGKVAATRPAIGRPLLGAAAGGAATVKAEFHIHGAMDPIAVGREIQRVLLHLKRVYGINVNLGVA